MQSLSCFSFYRGQQLDSGVLGPLELNIGVSIMLKLPDLYNLYHRVSVHAHSNLRLLLLSWTDPMSFSSSSSSFCQTELQRALKEQTFGIQNFSITSSSAEQASALVVLLEGQRLVVKLTAQGFSVRKKNFRMLL